MISLSIIPHNNISENKMEGNLTYIHVNVWSHSLLCYGTKSDLFTANDPDVILLKRVM